jgi:uncharacterized membrane protein
MVKLSAAAVAFIFLHLIPGTSLRPRLIRLLGSEKLYAALFAGLAAFLLYLYVRAFAAAPCDPPLSAAPELWRWLKPLVILLACVLIVGGVVSPNPSSPEMEGALDAGNPAKGVLAITRHPVMWGIALWAAAHLASQSNLRGLLFFGGLGANALFGSWLQQQRKARQLGERWLRFQAVTSFWPFAAIIAGRARLRLSDIGPWTPIIALILWLAMVYFHNSLIGVPSMPQLP